MKLLLTGIAGLLLGLVLGAAGAGLALRGEPAAAVRALTPRPDDDARRALLAAGVAAHLAEAENDGAPAALRQLAGSLRRLPGEHATAAALREYGAALGPLAEEVEAAAEADAGLRGAAGRMWAAVKSLAGDERREPNRAAVAAATAEVEAAAARVAQAADAAGLDAAEFCPRLPGLSGG